MALIQYLSQIRANVRRMADVQGTAAFARHPDTELNDYINRGLATLYRLLTQLLPDQRYLATTTILTESGQPIAELPADFGELISAEIYANGQTSSLAALTLHARPQLVDATLTGIPSTYRLQGSSFELLPSPRGAYVVTLWYVPTAPTLLSDYEGVDTIARLDEFVILYASALVATKNKQWDLADRCKADMASMRADIEAVARSRDKNAVARPIDDLQVDRYGRTVRR